MAASCPSQVSVLCPGLIAAVKPSLLCGICRAGGTECIIAEKSESTSWWQSALQCLASAEKSAHERLRRLTQLIWNNICWLQLSWTLDSKSQHCKSFQKAKSFVHIFCLAKSLIYCEQLLYGFISTNIFPLKTWQKVFSVWLKSPCPFFYMATVHLVPKFESNLSYCGVSKCQKQVS